MDNTELFQLVAKMYSEMNSKFDDMHNAMQNIQKDINQINLNMTQGFDNVTARIDDLSNDLGNMVTNKIADELSNQIKELKDDIKFLTHKTTETEKDVYKIQNHLKIIK